MEETSGISWQNHGQYCFLMANNMGLTADMVIEAAKTTEVGWYPLIN